MVQFSTPYTDLEPSSPQFPTPKISTQYDRLSQQQLGLLLSVLCWELLALSVEHLISSSNCRLPMRDWMTMAFTVREKTEANELYFQSIWGLYEFSPGFTAQVRRTELSR